MKEIIDKLIDKEDLSGEEAGELLEGIMQGDLSQIQTAMALTALKMKGESVEEIKAFIETLRKNMIKIRVDNAVDVCGTGGDGKRTFNISTAAGFVLAAGGVRIAKHGNRAASSKCGSADVLEELGIKIDLSPEQAQDLLAETGMVFLFAPLYHPAYKPVGIVRREMKIPTVFNFLGPFINPAGVKRQLIGIPSEDIAEKMTETAKSLGYKHLFIVSSKDGMDEVSVFAPTTVFEITGVKLKRYVFDPVKYFRGGKFENIIGGDAKQNAVIIRNIFAGKKGEARDMVVINSAFGFLAADRVKNIEEGIGFAERVIDDGRAREKMEEVISISNLKSQISKPQFKTKN